jgi:cbb3-type cytochrome c oxidase subunit III
LLLLADRLTAVNLFLEKQCAHCHGEDGKGGVNLARRVLDPKGVFQSIADGREKNGIRMPAWREVLTDEEMWKATAYVMSISQQSKSGTGHPVAVHCGVRVTSRLRGLPNSPITSLTGKDGVDGKRQCDHRAFRGR